MLENRKEKLNIFSLLCIIVILSYLVVFTIINFKGMAFFCDGDIYADMLLSTEMWKQKTPFPDNWVFGNQYYLVSTPVIAALIYGATGKMVLSMSVATGIMTVLIFAAFVCMMKTASSGKAAVCVSLLVLAASCISAKGVFSEEAQLLFTLASYYACYLLTMLVVFGDYAGSLKTGDSGFGRLTFIISLILSLLAGMQSLRQMLIMIFPVLALEMLILVFSASAGRLKTAVRPAAYLIANVSGCLLMRFLDIPHSTIYASTSDAAGSFSGRLLGHGQTF